MQKFGLRMLSMCFDNSISSKLRFPLGLFQRVKFLHYINQNCKIKNKEIGEIGEVLYTGKRVNWAADCKFDHYLSLLKWYVFWD